MHEGQVRSKRYKCHPPPPVPISQQKHNKSAMPHMEGLVSAIHASVTLHNGSQTMVLKIPEVASVPMKQIKKTFVRLS